MPTTDTIHILAFVTRESCELLACWLRWVSHWLTAPDAAATFRLTIQHHIPPPNATTAGARWGHVLRQRLSFVLGMLQTLSAGSHVFFTDVDVVPFQSYSALLPLPADLTYMREPPGHGGRTGRHIVNAGFFGLRVTPKVVRYFGHQSWLAKEYPRLMDQDIANWLLLAKPGARMHHRGLDWAT